MDDLKEKVIIVTGASRGLGRYLCNHFSGLRMKVAAIARSDERLKELSEEISKKGGDILTFPLDVTNYEKIEGVVEEIRRQWGSIDILINNAGVGKSKDFEKLDKQDIDSMIDVNLKGTIYFTRHVVPVMMKANSGYIINISSTASIRGLNNNGIYHASKFGIDGFSDSMSKYLLKNNIYVTTLCPGGINTSWYDGEWGDYWWDRKFLIEPYEIAELIELILKLRSTTLFKKAILFPTCESESW